MTSTLKTVRENWRSYLLWGLLFSLIIVPLATAMTMMAIHEADSSRPYVPELRKIADETPLYPGSRKTGERAVLKARKAYLFTYYQCDAQFADSDAQFADIEAFYARVLPPQGWTPPKKNNGGSKY